MRSYLSGKETPNYAWGERMRFLRAGRLALLIALGLSGYIAARYTWYAALWWRAQSTAASRAAASDGSASDSSTTDGRVESIPAKADDLTQGESAVVPQADGLSSRDGRMAARGPEPRTSLMENFPPADPTTAAASTPSQTGPLEASVEPVPPEPADRSDAAVGIGTAQPAATTPRPGDHRVHLANPVDSGGPVHFLAAGEVYTLRPGQSLVLPCHGRCRAEFHRGGEFGPATYDLEPGSYHFTVTESGWALVAADARPEHLTRPAQAAASP